MSGFNYDGPTGRPLSLHPAGPFENPPPLWTPHHPQHLSSASSYVDLQYLFGVQDPAMIAQKPSRNRRKSNQNPEHTKHRRTRSGCYTCRSRRVKCDEAHPNCERCRKGGRECIYPETSTSVKSQVGSSSKTVATASGSPGTDSDEYEDANERLESIPDGDESLDIIGSQEPLTTSAEQANTEHATSDLGSATIRQDSETPSLVQDKGASPTPSTEGSIGYVPYLPTEEPRLNKSKEDSGPGELRNDWSHLPPDLQFYLTYFYKNVTHLHYAIKLDSDNFLRTTFLDAALRNDALLHGIVGFAAFQRTLHNPVGKINDFLQYYNKAVSLLLLQLQRREKRDIGMLLAILQLAAIEEFLGDWVNLLGHQRAALEILTGLYTPKTIMEKCVSRVTLGWYMRFDVFAAMMGGFETSLSREWFSSNQDFYQQQVIKEPEVLDWKLELAIAQQRLLALDMSLLFSKMSKQEISFEQFIEENTAVGARNQAWRSNMDPALRDSRYLVTEFSTSRALDPEDIVDPYKPGSIYSGPLYVMNVLMIDWYALDMMHKLQTASITRTEPGAELVEKAFETCQLFESLEFWSGSPPGVTLACQASIAMAFLFLPKDERHFMWARRKLAAIEAHGYIYPYTFRTKFSDLFHDRSCMHWWLPNDEGYPPIVRSIRKLVEERTAPAKNQSGQDLHDMKAIFSKLKMDDGKLKAPSGKGSLTTVAVAPDHDSYIEQEHMQAMRDANAHEHGFDDGQGS